MPGYALFYAFSDFTIPGPRKTKKFQQLSELVIVHKPKFKPAQSVIQEKSAQIREWFAVRFESIAKKNRQRKDRLVKGTVYKTLAQTMSLVMWYL